MSANMTSGREASRHPMRSRFRVMGSGLDASVCIQEVWSLDPFNFNEDRTASITLPRITIRTSFIDLISHSQVPPKCGALGELNLKVTCWPDKVSLSEGSIDLNAPLNVASPPLKLIISSAKNSYGFPHWAMKR